MALQIKKFQAPTLQEAIEMVRNELGDDAIILQTDPVRTTGALSSRNKVEVTAAIDREDAPPPRKFHATVGETVDERPVSRPTESRARGLSALLSGATFGLGGKKTAPKVATTAPVKAKTTEAKKEEVSQSTSPASQNAANVIEKNSVSQLYAVKTFIEPLREEVEELKREMQKSSTAPKKKKFKDPLEEEVQKLREELKSFLTEKRYDQSKLPAYFCQLTDYWKEKGVGDRQVTSFFQQLEAFGYHFTQTTADSDAVMQVSQLLEGAIQEANVFEKNERRIVVLVGPTGAGKTTTLAKMAAYEKLRLNRKVAFITVDDFKIGGTDQLAHYARILEVPFQKSRGDISLEDQCKSFAQAQTIFVDTFGVSFRDEERLQTLKKILTFSDPQMAHRVEIHLVLPVGIATPDVQDCLGAYSEFKPKFLAFTKWDETDHWGGMLAAILASKKPVSFISHGQNVPDDFALFSKQSFIETITSIHGERG